MLGILTRVILPLMMMAGAGYVLQKAVRLDIRTLSKLNVNLLVPAFLFYNFYHFELALSQAWTAALFTWGVMAGLVVISLLTSRALGLSRSMAVAFVVSTVFYNSGNYGLSVMELVFGGKDSAMDLQAVVLTAQNVTNWTLGVFFISSGNRSARESLLSAVRYPIIPAFLLGILLRQFHVVLPPFLDTPTRIISRALVPMGLITLGAQVATVRGFGQWLPLSLSSLIRLVIGPLLGLAVIVVFRLSGHVAQVLLISSSVPTAVNTALLSIEFENESNFASQAVLYSTILSLITVSAVIFLAQSAF